MERRPHRQNSYIDSERRNSRRTGTSRAARYDAMDGASPKIQKIYLEEEDEGLSSRHFSQSRQEDTSDLTWPDRAADVTPAHQSSRRASTSRIAYDDDNWTSYDPYGEDLSEEVSYHEERMARRAARTSQRGQDRRSSQASQTSRSSHASQARRSTRSIRRASTLKEQQAAARRTRRTAGAASSHRRRRGLRLNKKKLLPFAAGAALVVIAAVITIIIFATRVKEAANLTLSSTDTTQTISWERKGKDTGFEVLQKMPDGSFQVVKTVSAEGSTAVTVEGLNSATLYAYKVRAIKGADHPKRSSGVSIQGYTAPSVLTDITASTQVKDSLTFVWSDTQPVAGFELRYGPSEDFHDASTVTLTAENIVVDEGNGKNTFTLENQPEGTKYYYAMRSYCDQNSYSNWTPTAIARVTRPVDMHGIDVNAPMVALTFDDGPDISNITSRILDAFAAVGGHATFFQLGQRAESYPEKIQRIVNEGHEIGNHTYDHAHMGDAVTSDDIIHANDAIEAAGGVRPVSFRSPGGNTTELIRQTCIQENMTLYYWSLDTRDWYTKDAAETVSYIKSHVADGDIILMHNIYDSSAEAVEEIVPWLVEQGYQLVTVSQLIVAKSGSLPEPGLEYYTGTKTLDR